MGVRHTTGVEPMFWRRKVVTWRPFWGEVGCHGGVGAVHASGRGVVVNRPREGVAESGRESDRWAQVSARGEPNYLRLRGGDHELWLPYARGIPQHDAYGWPRIWRRTIHVKRLCRAFRNNTRHVPWAQKGLRNRSKAVMRVELSQRRVVTLGPVSSWRRVQADQLPSASTVCQSVSRNPLSFQEVFNLLNVHALPRWKLIITITIHWRDAASEVQTVSLVAHLRHACCGRQPALSQEPHSSDAAADDLTIVCLEQQSQQAMHEQAR